MVTVLSYVCPRFEILVHVAADFLHWGNGAVSLLVTITTLIYGFLDYRHAASSV